MVAIKIEKGRNASQLENEHRVLSSLTSRHGFPAVFGLHKLPTKSFLGGFHFKVFIKLAGHVLLGPSLGLGLAVQQDCKMKAPFDTHLILVLLVTVMELLGPNLEVSSG